MLLLQRIVLALVLAGAFWSGARAAGDVAGTVKTVEGAAYIRSGGSDAVAKVGDTFGANDTLVTGRDGALGVTFSDNTRLSLGSDTEIAVEEYVFDPGRDNVSMVTRISKGTLAFTSGLISKLKPGSARVRTPTGTLGIRGTRFLVKVEAE